MFIYSHQAETHYLKIPHQTQTDLNIVQISHLAPSGFIYLVKLHPTLAATDKPRGYKEPTHAVAALWGSLTQRLATMPLAPSPILL